MQLISEAELNRLKAKQIREYDADMIAIARLETEIDNILNDTSKTESEKIAELRSAQLKSRNLREQEAASGKNTSSSMATAPAPTPQPAAAATGAAAATLAAAAAAEAAAVAVQAPIAIDAADEGLILKGLRGLNRQHAEKVITIIKNNPELITFDKQSRRLLINNEPVEGSNFIDIFDYTFASSVKSKKKPNGILAFYSVMNKLNVPQSYLARRNAYANIPTPPPGSGPNVLRVYPI